MLLPNLPNMFIENVENVEYTQLLIHFFFVCVSVYYLDIECSEEVFDQLCFKQFFYFFIF